MPGLSQEHAEEAQQSDNQADLQDTTGNASQQPTQAPDDAADQDSLDSSTFPPNLPGLLTTLSRSRSDELASGDPSSSRASSQISAHSALSRMLQDSSTHEHSRFDDGRAGWTLSAGNTEPAASGNSPDSAALQQLLHVVEGLEEELFSSEARRNDAEVT